jgi:chromosome segregation ATPase
MASQFDDSDFIDRDYQNAQAGYTSGNGHASSAADLTGRPPSHAELETRVGEAQQKLAELRRAQEELERERVALEEARRRRIEFQTGREEMVQNLTRGVALLEQAEFAARRDAEQMGKSLTGLREALTQTQAIQEQTWNQENWNVELTRALASIENARMEWNSARLKWPLLNGPVAESAQQQGQNPSAAFPAGTSFWQLCKLGAALTWPVAVLGMVGLALLLILRLR